MMANMLRKLNKDGKIDKDKTSDDEQKPAPKSRTEGQDSQTQSDKDKPTLRERLKRLLDRE